MFRVRAILSSLDTASMKQFTSLLKNVPSIPEECLVSVKYPNALLSHLPKENSYSLLGVITENMLRYPLSQITLDTLIRETVRVSNISIDIQKKIRVSKTTEPYLDHLRNTRVRFDEIVKDNMVEYDSVLSYESVEGHPDAKTETQLFEVKMTGQLKKEWKNFLFQAFSYAALELSATELYLVFPLQECIVSLELHKWPMEKRMKWRELLQQQTTIQTSKSQDQFYGKLIQQRFEIGIHINKLPSLYDTIMEMNTIQPFQIFLGSPTSAKLSISDEEIALALSVMGRKRVYVHTPYIINLCKDGNRDELLIKNIKYAVAIGCKGVIVHVGKTTKQDVSVAMEHMRLAVLDALQFATPECPLLLETPAGQGTETLTIRDEFLAFVMSFGDPRLAICVDTCHVFTNGHDPLEYVKAAYDTGLLRLIHFNDSATTCGACVDRHAYIGTGHIGVDKMTKLAAFGSACGVDMVVE